MAEGSVYDSSRLSYTFLDGCNYRELRVQDLGEGGLDMHMNFQKAGYRKPGKLLSSDHVGAVALVWTWSGGMAG